MRSYQKASSWRSDQDFCARLPSDCRPVATLVLAHECRARLHRTAFCRDTCCTDMECASCGLTRPWFCHPAHFCSAASLHCDIICWYSDWCLCCSGLFCSCAQQALHIHRKQLEKQ
mmetsp:Transcript_56804/g.184765  ORF Transcript_56804/g.184765 Transcript_56804/m.184765 type:complete len:116 (+) Transcript_56804:3-350(+)